MTDGASCQGAVRLDARPGVVNLALHDVAFSC
nr:MAG TPA: hypothetical protein [Caudoviricetes sp.]